MVTSYWLLGGLARWALTCGVVLPFQKVLPYHMGHLEIPSPRLFPSPHHRQIGSEKNKLFISPSIVYEQYAPGLMPIHELLTDGSE